MFIKGLELYGKAWKKIAMAIKTRTVVQIRTHAQKYFLKLSKARQNGDHLFGRGIVPGTKRRKSRHDRSTSLCVALQPFVVRPNPSSAYSSFASALSASALASTSAPVITDASLMPPPLSLGGSTTMGTSFDAQAPAPAPVRLTQSEVEKCLYNFLSPDLHKADRAPTEWYQRGLPISSLLADAEKLDWSTDGGVAVMPSAITSTSAAFKETKVSAESTAAKVAAQTTLRQATTSFDTLTTMGYMGGGGVRGSGTGGDGMKGLGDISGGGGEKGSTYDFNGEDDIFNELEHGYGVGLGL